MADPDLWAPVALFVAGAAIWTARLTPFARARRQAPPPVPAPWPAVSVIVPARNEAANLPALLDSLARLSPAPLEVIVVDDQSTDGTAAVARGHGAQVVTTAPLPAGWLGKPWACAAGARAARGQLLLFTDADTTHAPASLGAAVAALMAHPRTGLVSLVPGHRAARAWERLQAVFHLLLVVATRAGAHEAPATARGTTLATGERRFCIGQYLLFHRAAYLALGGHAAVRDRVAEDLAFARLIVRHGWRYTLLAAAGLLQVRMYPGGVRAFVAGWRRNFREGLGASGVAGIAEVALVIAALLGPPLWAAVAALRGQTTAAAAAALATLLATAEIARCQPLVMAPGAAPARAALAFPLFVALFALAAVLATMDRFRRVPVSWRGRSLEIRPRRVD